MDVASFTNINAEVQAVYLPSCDTGITAELLETEDLSKW